jgi:hypothetical protein
MSHFLGFLQSALFLSLFAADSLPRQQPVSAAPCDSVLRAARVDSVPVTARVYLLRPDGGTLPSRARDLVLQRILEHFVAPRPFALQVFGPGPAKTRMLRPANPEDSLTARAPMLYGVYSFAVSANGSIDTIITTVQSLAPGFDASVSNAITEAAGDSVLARIGRGLATDSLLQLELRITTGPEDPRLRVPPLTLFSAVLPVVRLVDAKPTGVIPMAQYPEEERDGRDGEALLRAVVDPSGSVIVSTMEVQHATSSAFALAAALAFVRYHFAPAHVDGCAVPQVVEVPFWFSLRP